MRCTDARSSSLARLVRWHIAEGWCCSGVHGGGHSGYVRPCDMRFQYGEQRHWTCVRWRVRCDCEWACAMCIVCTKKQRDGHTGARTQDHSVISTALYRLSYTTSLRPTHAKIIKKQTPQTPTHTTQPTHPYTHSHVQTHTTTTY